MLLGNAKKINVNVPLTIPKISKRLKKCSKESPENWKLYKRLTDPAKDACKVRDKYVHKGCAMDMPTVKFPNKADVLKCNCYENVMYILGGVCCFTPPVVDREIRVKQTNRWLKETNELFKDNERYQFPLATLNVRWQLKKNIPGYDLPTLYNIFSKYGSVETLRMTSPNSAMVVFKDLSVACHVSHLQYLGDPRNHLHCRFWHRTMENKAVVSTHRGSKVRRIPFL